MYDILMVDGDILLFEIARVTEDVSDFGDGELISHDIKSAKRLIESGLDNISRLTGYKRDNIVFSITDKHNFRKEHFPTYKSNRKKVRKPHGLPEMREYMLDNIDKFGTIMMESLEADDIMGIYGTLENPEQRVAIYSQDKDLFTIPTKQWCFKTAKFIYPEMQDSLKFLYTQVLTGDAVDGYKGCPKIGKVKAKVAIDSCLDEFSLLFSCHKLYYKQYGTEAKTELLKQIGQARILHNIDYHNLITNNITYNPYVELGINDTTIGLWEMLCDAQTVKKNTKKSRTSASTV